MQSILLVSLILLLWITGTHSATLTPQQKQELAQNNQKCMASSGLTPGQVTSVKQGKFPDDENTKKYFGCMFRGIGIMNNNGQLQLKALRAKMPKDVDMAAAAKILGVCGGQKGKNSDETAYLLYKCFYQNNPNHIDFGL